MLQDSGGSTLKRAPFSSLRLRLTLLVVLAILPVTGLTVSTYLKERALILKHIMSQVQLISHFASGTQERLLLTTRQLLVALSKTFSPSSVESPGCDDSALDQILSQNPIYANLGAILPDGRPFCSALPIAARPEGFSNQTWFKSCLKARDVSLGMAREADGETAPAIFFTYPVADDSGEVRFMVFASMAFSQFSQFASQMQLPGNTEFLLVSNSGTVLAYLPDPTRFAGKTLPEAPLIRVILARGNGDVEIEGLDGLKRLYAFTPLSSTVETNLYLGIGIPEELAYAEANRGLVRRFIILGVVTILTLSLMWMGTNLIVVRRVQVVTSAIYRLLGRGVQAQTGHPQGKGELDHLEEAFDDLAAILEGQLDQLKEGEAKLLDYQNQLRALSSQLISFEERERQRIATDLHDGIGQTLALSRIKLGLLKEAAASSEYAQSIQEIRRLITDAVRDTKSLIFKMSSPVPHEMGIDAALQWLAEQTRRQHGLDVRCETDDRNKPLDPDVRSFLFRAASELLINCVKHSGARQALITATADGEKIRVEVRDDGNGFDVSEVECPAGGVNGFGLFSIRERLGHIGGSMEIESRPGRGARITLTAPLSSSPSRPLN